VRNAADATDRPPAGAWLADQSGHVAGAEPQDGHGLLAERGEDEFARFAVGQWPAALRVDQPGERIGVGRFQLGDGAVQEEKARALEAARLQIEKQFGKGSLMKLGGNWTPVDVDVIPSGSILLDADNQGMMPLTELLLYAAARAQHVAEVIRPALETDAIVLCDRFTDATVAYQHSGRGIDRPTIDALNTLACQSVRPDLTVLMDCDVATGLARAKSRIETSSGPREERFELETLAFHQRVREGYLGLAAGERGRFLTISASGTIDEISGRIASHVLERLNAIC